MSRQIRLGLFLLGTGGHTSGWRVPGATDTQEDIGTIIRICQEAERGLLDLIFVGDNLNADPSTHPSYCARLEPVTMLSAVALATQNIGLGATASTTYGDPWSVARLFGSLDHISGGRAGWNAVTTSTPQAASNFGMQHPDHARRYEICNEFIQVARDLWDAWEDGAIIKDRAAGRYFDETKIHPIDHDGTFFKVKGPLNMSRCPQGRPLILQAGGSVPGQEIAARHADVVFSVTQSLEEAQAFYASLKGRLAKNGRSPESLAILPGVMPVVGRTEAEARAKLAELTSYIDQKTALTLLSERFNMDLSGYDLDGPLPDMGANDAYHAFANSMLSKARREHLTLRDLFNLVATARGHWVLCGSAEQIADTLQEWFETGAADGFNLMPGWLNGGLTDFIDLVIPILQDRGLYKTEYAPGTLREKLGMPT
ncbi:LLM class flavin-dependent oxidoreductase [Sinirhodobacter populi]|uniref:LLM class flavin-dependent oxidoreductase n=1 Tax=Paenirhodobacter populi TaxID=2306993 RepID=A0A443KAU0_9RHOB|nr:LLM class flavin-dependent oxidoreductase [Sinirhodobacter populi]RWR29880.1 LLM class flavin-dependent oxidoreductase [Sinirhodobacter populi]